MTPRLGAKKYFAEQTKEIGQNVWVVIMARAMTMIGLPAITAIFMLFYHDQAEQSNKIERLTDVTWSIKFDVAAMESRIAVMEKELERKKLINFPNGGEIQFREFLEEANGSATDDD